jgi:hypothetical protein
MAQCSSITLNGVALGCSQSGGIKKLWLSPTSDVTGITVATGTGVYTGLTVVSAISMATAKKFKEYSFRRGNADFSFKSARDVKQGTVAVDTTINLQFNKMEAVKRAEMEQLVQGEVYAIIQDNNDLYWFIGHGSYVDVTSLDGQTGAELKDGNFYKLVLGSQTTVSPYEIQSDGAGVSTVVAGVI